MEKRSFTVSPQDEGQRLDRFLDKYCPDLSRSRLQNLIALGWVSLGPSLAISCSVKIKLGMEISLSVPPIVESLPQAQLLPLDIVFEDDDLLVLNKAPGMVVHPAPGSQDQTVVNALLAHCGTALSQRGGLDRPGIVHRLDKGTSGLLVVAKNDFTHEKLTEQFADRSLSRTYQALIWGILNPLQGDITGDIGRSPHHRQKMAIVSQGKSACTHYKTLETYGCYASLVECTLESGRTHQIRVHLTSKGHGIIGDPVYVRPLRAIPSKLVKALTEILKDHKPLLHAWRLKFIHPRSELFQTFCVEPPQEFKDAQEILKNLSIFG